MRGSDAHPARIWREKPDHGCDGCSGADQCVVHLAGSAYSTELLSGRKASKLLLLFSNWAPTPPPSPRRQLCHPPSCSSPSGRRSAAGRAAGRPSGGEEKDDNPPLAAARCWPGRPAPDGGHFSPCQVIDPCGMVNTNQWDKGAPHVVIEAWRCPSNPHLRSPSGGAQEQPSVNSKLTLKSYLVAEKKSKRKKKGRGRLACGHDFQWPSQTFNAA